MRRIPTLLLTIALTTLIASAIAGTAPLDASWPGSTPELFAPGVVNTDGVEINLVFDRDNTELFFARTVDKVFFVYTSRLEDKVDLDATTGTAVGGFGTILRTRTGGVR